MWQCPKCAYIVNGGVTEEFVDSHECDPRSVVRRQIAQIPDDVAEWLNSPAGQFESWLEQRRR